MVKKFPLHPQHPERICWGCDTYCPVDAMRCGSGSIASPHPAELFGEDWGLGPGRADEIECADTKGSSTGLPP
ncbi:DUF3079 domain-containing protein [Paucibacter sp. JuS9]|uniref:DUF3079 domain-containing protein n=1 Tax=Roseateles TaxID=93681 RepID=UPI002FE6B119